MVTAAMYKLRRKETKFEGPSVQKHSIILLDTLTQHAK